MELLFRLRKGVYFKLVPSRKRLWCDGWTERVKSLQTDNRHKRPYIVFRSKSALSEQFIPPLACSQGTFSFLTLTDGLGLCHEACAMPLNRKVQSIGQCLRAAFLSTPQPMTHGPSHPVPKCWLLIQRGERRVELGAQMSVKKNTCMQCVE